MQEPKPFRFETAQWAFPVALTLHNLEEAVCMPSFWAARSWHTPIDAFQFRALTALVAAASYVLTYFSIRWGRRAAVTYAWACLNFVMLLNGCSHVAVTLYFRAYAPGVATALLVVMPVTIYLLIRGRHEGYF